MFELNFFLVVNIGRVTTNNSYLTTSRIDETGKQYSKCNNYLFSPSLCMLVF